MAGEVGDADDGQAACDGGTGRIHGADDQAAGEAGPARHRDCVDGVPATLDRREGRVDHRGKPFEMRSRGQLGHDTTVDRVQRDLRGHDRGTDLAAVREHRRRGLVAGGLDGEEVQADGYSIDGAPPTPATSRPLRIALKPRLNSGAWMLSLHMITASSPLSV